MGNLRESGQNLIKQAAPFVAVLGISTAADSVSANGQNLPPAIQDPSHTVFIETPDLFLNSGLEFQNPTPIPEAIEIITPEGQLSEIPTLNFQDFASDGRFDSTFASINEVNDLFSKFLEERGLVVNSFRIVVAGSLSGTEIIPTPTPEANQENILYYSYEGGGVLAEKINGEWKLYSQRNFELAQAVGLIQNNEIQGSETVAANWYIVPDKENLKLLAYDRAHPELGVIATSVNTAYNEAIWIPNVVYRDGIFVPISEQYARVLDVFVRTVELETTGRDNLDAITPEIIKNDINVLPPTGELLSGYFKIENGRILVWRPNMSFENTQDMNVIPESGWVVLEDVFNTISVNQQNGITWILERKISDVEGERFFSDEFVASINMLTNSLYSDESLDGKYFHITQIGSFSSDQSDARFLLEFQQDTEGNPVVAFNISEVENSIFYEYYVQQRDLAYFQNFIDQGWIPPQTNRPLINLVNEQNINLGIGYLLRIIPINNFEITPYELTQALGSGSHSDEINLIQTTFPEPPLIDGTPDLNQLISFVQFVE